MAELRTSVDAGVATVTLDAPDRRNALSLGLVDEIVVAFDQLEADPSVGAAVVTGAPPAFCAGADLSHLGASQREGLVRIYEGFLRIGRSPLPTIAAVNGAAVGAGVNLALVCDVIVAGASARTPAAATRGCCSAASGCRPPPPLSCSARSSTVSPRPRQGWRGARCPTTSCWPRPPGWRPKPRPRPATWCGRSSGRWATCPRWWPTPRPSSASSTPRSGRSTSPPSRSAWRRCAARSAVRRERHRAEEL